MIYYLYRERGEVMKNIEFDLKIIVTEVRNKYLEEKIKSIIADDFYLSSEDVEFLLDLIED